jgi:hypothetical protein
MKKIVIIAALIVSLCGAIVYSDFVFARRPAGVKRIEGRLFGYNGTSWRRVGIDSSTRALRTVSYPHSEAHGGSRYLVNYSVASLGAMAAPDDMITLTWTTPNTTQWEHFTFYAIGTGGWRLRLIEAPTGGAASQTEQFVALNHNRNIDTAAACIALDSTAGEVSYDATLATGGTTLWDEYVPGGSKAAGNVGSDRDEFILKQGTKYQLSLYGTDTDPASLHIDFYQHTDKD